jgi:SAM-dependent methyltransferase
MTYVHGYDAPEAVRLQDQASTLAEFLHGDRRFAPGARVLEAGCGVGAQTVILAARNPAASFVSVDVSAVSVEHASAAVQAHGFENVVVQQADIMALPFAPGSFDHVFVCFVLEHLEDPVTALAALAAMLKPGGTITTIEGDHGSTFFHPRSDYAERAVQCQITLQARARGNALIGRELYPLLAAAGFSDIRVSPRMVYVDGSKPALIDGFTRKTFTAMIEGIREPALAAAITNEADFDRGVADLYRTAAPDGVFCYTFFTATATKT